MDHFAYKSTFGIYEPSAIVLPKANTSPVPQIPLSSSSKRTRYSAAELECLTRKAYIPSLVARLYNAKGKDNGSPV